MAKITKERVNKSYQSYNTDKHGNYIQGNLHPIACTM